MVGAVPEEEPELSAPLSLKVVPSGSVVPAPLGTPRCPPGHCAVTVSLQGLAMAVTVTVTGSSCWSVSALLTSARLARAGTRS